ncbi:mucin-2-like [Haliotis asinina]|uniref:mucin-2-like n=1 Tax=Haliotis asinina TaxID=109174 RepID=UPI003531FC03
MLSLGLWLTILAFPIVGAQVLTANELRAGILANCNVIYSMTSSNICQNPALITTCTNFFVMAEICRWTRCNYTPIYPDFALIEVVEARDNTSYQLLVDQCGASTTPLCQFARTMLAFADRLRTGSTAAPATATTVAMTTQPPCPVGTGNIACVPASACSFSLMSFTCPNEGVCCASLAPTTTTTPAPPTTTVAITTTLQPCPVGQGSIACVSSTLCPGSSLPLACPTSGQVCCLDPLTTTTMTTTTTTTTTTSTPTPCPVGQGSIACVSTAFCPGSSLPLACPTSSDVCCLDPLTTTTITTTTTTTTMTTTTTPTPCPVGQGNIACTSTALCPGSSLPLACPTTGDVCCLDPLTTTTITTTTTTTTMTTTTTPTPCPVGQGNIACTSTALCPGSSLPLACPTTGDVCCLDPLTTTTITTTTTTTTMTTTTTPTPCPVGQGTIACTSTALCPGSSLPFACPTTSDVCCIAPLTTTTMTTTSTTTTTTTPMTTTTTTTSTTTPTSLCLSQGLNCRTDCDPANRIGAGCPMATQFCCIV